MSTFSPYEAYIRLAELKATWPGPDWPEQTPLTCGLQALELLGALCGEVLADSRHDVAHKRAARLADVVCQGLSVLGQALSSAAAPDWALTTGPPVRSAGLAALRHLPQPERQRVDTAWHHAFAHLKFDLGVDGRGHSGLPVLDYRAVVTPPGFTAVQEGARSGPEDFLFRTVHQVTECWVHAAHWFLARATRDVQGDDLARAGRALHHAARLVELASRTTRLLDLMVAADYHPLRVRLRDGSGAQSAATHALVPAAREAFTHFQSRLREQGLGILAVLHDPEHHRAAYACQAGFQELGRRFQGFLFEHYLLALSMLGSNNLGSLGFPVHALAQRAAVPLFPELDQAKHDFVVITNLAHNEFSGAIILGHELDRHPGAYPHPVPGDCPPELARERVAEYFACLERGDRDGWVALFTPEAWFLDAARARPFLGHTRLRVFVDTMLTTFSGIRVELGESTGEAGRYRVAWSIRATALGEPVRFGGTEEFVFTDDGRILAAQADWDATPLAEHLLRARRAA
ncbi:hypothetical protein JOF53_007402 [Crossiella equi]|uniref:SnoaL-like domain-containing protein n=1 Tax=Crossiella equi TaxID=130796 RepID=A0ABS5APM6_9PSEU|nr:nuclear transport factor 2 family protein [Crossiella equi]MBP2478530.1 hypothetical protein [Crossiella equi]